MAKTKSRNRLLRTAAAACKYGGFVGMNELLFKQKEEMNGKKLD
jgi:hypothetical protein